MKAPLLFPFLLVMSVAPSLAAAATVQTAPTDTLVELMRARAGEALDLADVMGYAYWPTFKVEELSLLVLDPGHGGLLFNHPNPPAGFTPAAPVVRHPATASGIEASLEEQAAIASSPPARGPGWSVHLLSEEATAPYRAARSSYRIAGRRTARVMMDEVSVPRPAFGGLPPAEAVIGRMAGALFLAHLDEREGEPQGDPAASYRVDAEDLSLIALEQRQIAWLLRMTYNEKTMAQYRHLAAEWLAVRRARLARNPQAVALEEAIERREGLADYTETLPSRVLADPGHEKRQELEAADPFFDRYANHFILRINTINYPMTWYPTDAAEALKRARATGTALAGAVWPMSVRWNLTFFGTDKPEKRTLREAIEQALKEGKPEITETDAELLKAASEREGLPAIRALLEATLARKGRGGASRPATAGSR